MKCRDKVVVVTGAGSGMGRELVFELLRRKARVAGVDRNGTALEETAKVANAPHDALETFTLSVADRAMVEALPRAVEERFGAVDGLINCAGVIQPFTHLVDLDYADIDRVFDVNFRGTLYMTKAFLPSLLARPEAHIVNISSMGGFLPVPGQTAYGASKAAVKLLTEGLQAELAQTNVRVTVVFPGAIATNIAGNSGVTVRASAERQRFTMRPADRAARDILDGMEGNRYRVVVGRDARLLDVFYRLDPVRATAFIAKQMKDLLPPARRGDPSRSPR
jgi:NAD(P)-dependent dehydrogenase (short-subunit alcohol dehydrogenase family)